MSDSRRSFALLAVLVLAACSRSDWPGERKAGMPALIEYGLAAEPGTAESESIAVFPRFAPLPGEHAVVPVRKPLWVGRVKGAFMSGSGQDARSVSIELEPKDAERFKDFVVRNLGQDIALVLEGRVIWVQTVFEPISFPLTIGGKLTLNEAEIVFDHLR